MRLTPFTGPNNPIKHWKKRQSCQIDPCLPPYKGALYMGKMGSIWHFGGFLQILVKTSTWRQCPQMLAGKARKKAPKREKWPNRPYFPQDLSTFGSQNPYKTGGKTRKLPNRPVFAPPLVYGPSAGCWKPRGPKDWKNSILRDNIEKIKLSIRNEIFNREWFFHSGPLSGRRKTRPEIEIFNREWNFQTENEKFKREWKFRAWGNGFFMRSSENEFFRSPGPLGRSPSPPQSPRFLPLRNEKEA